MHKSIRLYVFLCQCFRNVFKYDVFSLIFVSVSVALWERVELTPGRSAFETRRCSLKFAHLVLLMWPLRGGWYEKRVLRTWPCLNKIEIWKNGWFFANFFYYKNFISTYKFHLVRTNSQNFTLVITLFDLSLCARFVF